MKHLKHFLFIVLCLLTATGSIFAQAPRTLSYQGMLTDATGKPLSGTHTVTVRMYDAAVEGRILHTESFTPSISNGVFSVILGTSHPITSAATFDKPYWIGVSVDNGDELTPRTIMTSVPFAMHADVAAGLAPGASGAVTRINGAAGDLEINAGQGINIETLGNTVTISALTNAAGKNATPQQTTFVNSVAGTTNQVYVNGGTASQIGAVTFTLPQNIHTGATPTFSGMTLSGLSTAGVVHNNASGTLSTSLIVDADVAASAAIADTKLATISTSGKVANSATTATSSNTANTIVLRDGSGNFTAGTITADLNGNAATATSASTATNFTGSLSGDVTGTQSATVVSAVGGQTAAAVASGAAAANAATSANTPSTIVKRDASGNFSATTVTASLTGNVIGNVVGNVTGNLTGNVVGNLLGFVTGNVTGNVVGNLTGNVTGNVSGTSANVTGIVSETHGGTNQSSYAAGDMLYASGVNTLSKLGAGAAGTVLTEVGGLPAWTPLPVVAPVASAYVVISNDPTLTSERALQVGAGLSLADGGANGNVTLANTGVLSVAGTANQVNVTGSTGNVTFSLPQNIHTAATPQFSGMKLTGLASGSTATNIVVSNAGQMETRTVASLNDTYWSRTGNAGTTPGTDYVGTSDAQALYLGVGGAPSVILNTNGSVQRDAAGNARGTNAIDLQMSRTDPSHVSSGDYSAIGGGLDNTSSGFATTVSGGQSNGATLDYASVGGGFDNQSSYYYSTIGGGFMNTSSNYFSFVGGGQSNGATGYSSAIAGGYNNHTTSDYSAVVGGQDNFATGMYSIAGGGFFNQSIADFVTVGGGFENQANNSYAVIGGGYLNASSGVASTTSGGSGNQALGDYSSVTGGNGNVANATSSTIIGGGGNTTSPGANYSVASGLNANATQYGQNVQASGAFANVGDAQSSVYVERGTTNSTAPVNLTLDGGTTELTIANNTTVAFHILVAARDNAGNSASYVLDGNVVNNGGVASVVSSATTGYVNGFASGTVSVGVTGTTLNVTATDLAGASTVRWVARITTSEVTF